MAFDDYEWDHPDGTHKNPKPAIDAWLNKHKNEIEILRKGWQVWVRKKQQAETVKDASVKSTTSAGLNKTN